MDRLAIMQQPLCQKGSQSCAACCGVFNFADRSPAALGDRLRRRTALVADAGWDPVRLAAAYDALAAEEAPLLLFKAVRTCPLAGFLDEKQTRVGCMIHPLRHPEAEDLRDLGAYRDKGICSGHLCAPHTWLDPVDRAFLQCAPTWRAYSMAVGESGFVKAVLKAVANRRGGEVQMSEFDDDDVKAASRRILDLMDHWPFADPDPRRFGGFSFAGDEAYERTAETTARFQSIPPVMAAILDALGTRAPDEATALRAKALMEERLQGVVDALELRAARDEED